MAVGPGKYDALTSIVRKRAAAKGAIVMVIDGRHGSGFSVQATTEVTAQLPRLLRVIADRIEQDINAPDPE